MAYSEDKISELALAFTKDPQSLAFKPLAEAYLSVGRFAEASIVAKKGIQSHPSLPDGRILLATILIAQNKMPKAFEEITTLLGTYNDHADVHALHGRWLEKNQEEAKAIEAYKTALRHDKNHSSALEELQKRGIDWKEEVLPEVVPVVYEVTSTVPVEVSPTSSSNQTSLNSQSLPSSQGVSLPEMTAPFSPSPLVQNDVSVKRPRTHNPMPYSLQENVYAHGAGSSKKSVGLASTLVLASVVLLTVGGLFLYFKSKQQREEDIALQLKQAKPLIDSESTKNLVEAMKHCEIALQKDPHYLVGQSLCAYGSALLGYERAVIDWQPKSDGAIATLGNEKEQPYALAARMTYLMAKDKAAEALALGAEEAKQKNGSIIVKIAYGKALVMNQQWADAVMLAEELSATASSPAHTWSGDLYRRLGELEKARTSFDKAVKFDMRYDPARALRALFLLEQDDVTNLDVAIDDIRSVRDMGSDGAGPLVRGLALLAFGQISKRNGAVDQAERDWADGRRLLGLHPERLIFDARQLMQENKWTEAVPLLQDAVKKDPRRIDSGILLARALSKLKKITDANKAVSDVRSVMGERLELQLISAEILRENDKVDEAIELLKLSSKTSASPVLLREMGKAYLTKRDAVAAADVLKSAVEKSKGLGNSTRANILTLLGNAYAADGKHDEAIIAYNDAVNAYQTYAPAFYFMGISFEARNKGAAAKEAFSKVLKLDPGGKYADRARERLR